MEIERRRFLAFPSLKERTDGTVDWDLVAQIDPFLEGKKKEEERWSDN